MALCESGRHGRREGDRRRKAGAGPKYELVFSDRLLVTPGHLRTGLTHEALGVVCKVGSSTIGRAIREVHRLSADRGFAVPDRPGIRLWTLEDVFACARGRGRHLADRREGDPGLPPTGGSSRPAAFVSGERRQNTVKTTRISDGRCRTLWSGAQRPGRMHDQTSVRTEGIAEQFHQHPGVRAEVDDGYRGLASEFLDQVSAPPKTEGHEGSERRAGHRAVRLA
ncbi:hypothetical protein ACFZDP_30935 [Streptomyces mirabilis]|uniref:hypothetical protein n=1 Tax=Streptomyces mirabilis TaxID=68239 RepID=UPI0036E026E8